MLGAKADRKKTIYAYYKCERSRDSGSCQNYDVRIDFIETELIAYFRSVWQTENCRRTPGAELLFQVFADRYERRSLLITSNLAFIDWGQIFQGERMTAALLDRLTHHCSIFEVNGESYRFKESIKQSKSVQSPQAKAK